MIILFKYYVDMENCENFRGFDYIYIYIYMFGWGENKVKNDIFHCLIERERGRESGGVHKFSLPPSKYNFSKLERKLE